jgi:hypothetical protein
MSRQDALYPEDNNWMCSLPPFKCYRKMWLRREKAIVWVDGQISQSRWQRKDMLAT